MQHKEKDDQQQQPLSNLEELKIVSGDLMRELETQPLTNLVIEESRQSQTNESSNQTSSSKKATRSFSKISFFPTTILLMIKEKMNLQS